MRSVIIGTSLVLLCGCATISMVPGEATVETELSTDQTALHTTADDYCEELEDKGWVVESRGLANLASILMTGRSGVQSADPYQDQFGDTSVPPSDLVSEIAENAQEARLGLAAVSTEARRVLEDESVETQRKDVTSFERALVHAQRASRAFSEALDTVAERTTMTGPADNALDALNTEIDEARRLADELAARYASLGDAAA